MTTPIATMLSPCTGVCTMAPDGLCDGCHRTSAEIGGWTAMSDDQRLHLMDVVLPDREARRLGR